MGSVCRGQMLCLKIASEGDCYSHSMAYTPVRNLVSQPQVVM